MTGLDEAVYLGGYLSLISSFLSRSDVSDIHINRPGELWLEVNGREPERHLVPQLTQETLFRIARQIAALSAQGISREHPILAASLPTGERVQIVIPPATRSQIAMSIRRQVVSSLDLTKLKPWESGGGDVRFSSKFSGEIDGKRLEKIIRAAVLGRKTILISGGTSSGKTTLVNTMMNIVPAHERLIVIEDVPEIGIPHENSVGLIAHRSELRESHIDTNDLLVAALRMRPDRIILGEIRGHEAVSFLRAVNTGHPGSISTIHANSCEGAIDQLAFLAMQGGLKLGLSDIRKYIESAIDLSINLTRIRGQVYFTLMETGSHVDSGVIV